MVKPRNWHVQETMLSVGSSAAGLHYVDEKAIMLVSGAYIKIGSVASLGAPATFLQCPTPHGISCATANWRRGVLAFAEKGMRPTIYVHVYPSLKRIAKLEGGAELEVCALSFARNRPWLYSLSQEPDLSFCVWDWESGLTVCKATALTQSVQLLANPTNEHFSAMVTRSAITLWHVREMHDQHSLSALQLTPPAPERSEGGDDDIDLAALGGAVAEGGVSSFSAIAWGSDTLLYASTASALLCCFEVPGGAEVAERRVQLPAAAACLLSLRQHLLAAVGFDVLFLELESLAVCLRVRVGAPTRHLALSPLCTSLLAECADGEVRRLVLAQPNKIPSTADAARAAAAQLAAESAEGGAAEDGADEGGADEPVSVVSIGSAHAGAVLGLGLLPALDGGASEHGPPPCAITCGADGTLRLWDIASASLLLSEALPAGTQPTALAVCRPNALVALGSDRGVLRLYRRTPAGSLAAVFVRRFSASPIAALGFDADGAYLAVAHEDGTVAFVCTFKALKTLGVCVGAVPSRPVALSFVGGSATARLLLSCADRTVVRLLPPALSTPTADDVRLTRADVLPRATKLPALAHALAAAPPALGAGGLLAALSDGSVRLFHCAPDDYAGGALQGDEVGVRVGGEAGGAAGAAAPPLAGEVCARHPTPALALGVSADGRHFISGSAAGVILVSEAVPAEGAARAEVSIRAHDSLLGGVAHVGLLASHGHESLALVSAGADGLLYFGELSVSDGPCSLPPLPPNELNSAPVPPEEADAEDEAVPDALDTAVAHVSAEESARRAAAREAGHARLSELQRKLASLLERNERADELERLPMAELVVDEKLRAQLAAEAQAEAAALKQAARRANLRKELLWARLKAELVEPMATAGVAILPLPLPEVDIDAPAAGVVVAAANARKAAGGAEAGAQELPPAVTNYPLRRPTDAEARAQRGIALLREVELRERAWLATERLGEEELALTAFEDPAALTAAIGVLPGEEADGKANAAKAALAGVAGADENEDDEDEAEAAADAAHAADEADGADADADAADGAHAPEIASRRQSAAAAAAAVAAAAAAAAAPSSSAAAPAPGAGASAHHAVALLAAAAGRPLTTRELAYPPYELYTERRQIAAAHLHAQLVWQAKAKFNGQFDGLLAHKRKEMEKIVEKDQRVNEICAELGEPSAAYKPQLSELEEPERQLSVHPSEIAAQRWETAEDRQRREANEKLASERAAAAERDDAARRALKQMMHGTLERKREAELSESLVRPAWMSAKPPEEMSEAELAQVRDYEAAAKKVEEERDKLRKGLHAELAKLHAETAEICRAFNAKLAALAATKLGYEQAVYEHELVLIKAAHSHARAAQAAEQEEQMAAELERLIGRRAETSAARSAFAARVERWREGLEKAEAENRLRGNEKTFRYKEFADAPEHVDALWRLFKRRELVTVRTDVARAEAGEDDVELDAGAATADGSVPPASAASGAAGAPSRTDLVTVRGVSDLDPFLPADQAAIPRKEEVQPLDPAAEMPEGLSFALWDRLDRLRAEKVQREEEVAERKAALESMETTLAELEAEDEEVEKAVAALEQQLDAFRDARERAVWDVPIPLKLKQGQVEVEQAAVVTDFAATLFVPRATVRLLNADIKRLGGEKVEILREVRDFRRGIAELVWENERLGMESDDLVERTRELQLLRVTKDLQKLMKGGGEGRHAAELSQLERKLEAMGTAHEQRVAECERQLSKMRRLKAEKDAELGRLHLQIEALEQAVSERETIAHIQSSAGGDNSLDAGERVHHVHMKRKLKSLIQMQAQEIDLLREELDRLRRRTFPTFTHYEQARRHPVD